MSKMIKKITETRTYLVVGPSEKVRDSSRRASLTRIQVGQAVLKDLDASRSMTETEEALAAGRGDPDEDP